MEKTQLSQFFSNGAYNLFNGTLLICIETKNASFIWNSSTNL